MARENLEEPAALDDLLIGMTLVWHALDRRPAGFESFRIRTGREAPVTRGGQQVVSTHREGRRMIRVSIP